MVTEFLSCPICGKATPLKNFNSTDWPTEINIIAMEVGGRGGGSTVIDRYPADEATLDLIKTRILALLPVLGIKAAGDWAIQSVNSAQQSARSLQSGMLRRLTLSKEEEGLRKELSKECSFKVKDGKLKIKPDSVPKCIQAFEKLGPKLTPNTRQYLAEHVETEDPTIKEYIKRIKEKN